MANQETAQLIAPAGLDPVLAAADAAGHEFPNTGAEYIEWKNTSGANRTITVVTNQTVEDLAVADLTKTIATGKTDKIGPLRPALYNDAAGKAAYSFDNETSVTQGVFKLEAVS